MKDLLQYFILIPLLGFFISLLVPRRNPRVKEAVLSWIVFLTTSIHFALVVLFVAFWLLDKHPALDAKHMVIFKNDSFEIFIDYYFDKITAVYALIGSLLTFLVAIFSRYYLHREEGFKRFFNLLLLFFLGYNIIVFSGNFETLFVGWELLGLASFLLIAFYRDRFLPVKNAFKVISLYRLSDICLLLGMWFSHQVWHRNIAFNIFNDTAAVTGHLQHDYLYCVLLSLLLIIASAIKSAQFPFSSWLPRAMEGPTTSSAIFYGSLSTHIGVFVLLRTYPFWEGLLIIKILIIAGGFVTALIASGISRVQSSVKAQIAYSSITQVGLMFVEIALGWHNLALVHFMGNAFLRTYQLLVSPSVLSYRIHNQFYTFDPQKQKSKTPFMPRLRNTLYVLSTREWNLDAFLFRVFWYPFKWAGNKLGFLVKRPSLIILGVIYALGLCYYLFEVEISKDLAVYVPVLFSVLALLILLKAFTERGNAKRAWIMVFSSQLFTVLSILLNEAVDANEMLIYFSGTTVAAMAGFVCLNEMQGHVKNIELDRFHGYVREHPKLGLVFLLSCLGVLGFPITPTFIGIDLLFSHIDKGQYVLLICTGTSLALVELSVIRIYLRIFMGQPAKKDHAMAYRSS